ncbi:XRE family transcriptional regulator [Psychrobacter sp. Ps1]|uniref:helix-turn-helix domain-containing protein n=1 Tax=Psychrobacter sp. Ps1 TaxID=2790955 RepID=UPI001EDDB04B|nr:helix-turn-helix domain-containing protein [Psychrobacter sp. Ps1]MCG3841626.1 XRE family transcriptional regulator [Psychrobacter sp. Ps1]
MTHLTTLDDLMAALPADRQQRIKNKANILSQSIELAKLRRAMDLKQTDLAALMGVSQANISKVESGKDIQLSTLQNYISAMGGEVSIIAKMPNNTVTLI